MHNVNCRLYHLELSAAGCYTWSCHCHLFVVVIVFVIVIVFVVVIVFVIVIVFVFAHCALYDSSRCWQETH